MNVSNHPYQQRGFTLIELMVAVAIISVIAAIAIPAYRGYVREAKLGVARQNMDSMRLFLEDFQLDNGTYKAGGNTTFTQQGNTTTDIADNFGWSPDGDQGNYTYTVTATANSYDILAVYIDGTWMRCEGRMGTCCDGGPSDDSSTCP